MTDTKYSKVIISKIIDDDRKYQVSKLGSQEISLEGFKIIKAILPSVGVGIDTMISAESDFGFLDNNRTVASAFQLLAENLESEHFQELQLKLLRTLMFNGKDLEDWSEHFDNEEYAKDFLEILVWAFKENFYSFFMESTILSPMLSQMKEGVLLIMKTKMQDVLKSKEQESSEK